jgi:hypothetical protein
MSTVVRRSAAAALAVLVPGVVCWGGPGALARTTSAGTTADIISTVAGGVEGPALAAKAAVSPCGLQSDGNTLYIGDGYNGGVLRAVNEKTGWMTTPAGVGVPSAQFGLCSAAADEHGNLLIADTGGQTVLVLAARTGTFYGQAMQKGGLYTVAGVDTYGICGDEDFGYTFCPADAEPDHQGNIVVAVPGADDQYPEAAYVEVIAGSDATFYGQQMTAGQIYTVAGGGTGFSGDGGPALDAGLGTSVGQVRVDAAGNLVIADTDVDRVRVVAEQTGTFYGQAMKPGDIYTVGGNGQQGLSGTGGPATQAGIATPLDTSVDSAGNLVISDDYYRLPHPVSSER